MSGPDLSLVPTKDLVAALEARFDYLIFAGIRDHQAAHGTHEHHQRWAGNTLFCVGMAVGLIRDMQDWERDPDEEAPEAEDEEGDGEDG